MAPRASSDFQELVDSPNETLDVEYKDWLDLADNNEARADLAATLLHLPIMAAASLPSALPMTWHLQAQTPIQRCNTPATLSPVS